ncbi:IS5/IS1182 family transposase [Thiomicrospira microaerophila]|uniref:IS5/IS1182 family transposase n=1 Tax=Thiomicrospira microaerophila TaxID=406020 RepID=UPI0005CA6CBB|nr:IS5/IS1182 family transposase [Thiomicrospira microaerophila]
MAWKNLSQNTLAYAFICHHLALNELDVVEELIDWSACEALMLNIHSNPMGERAFPPLLMFKILLLQIWYSLSDPSCEKQLARDLLFCRLVQLSLTDSVPDHSTIWRFRQRLQKDNLLDALFENINNQLRQQGLIMKAGEVSIIDASVIQAKNNRLNKNAAGSSHDTQIFETPLTGSEKVVYANSAYKSQVHEKLLKTKRIKNDPLHCAYRNTPLTEQQKQHNRLASEVRYIVERTFGVLKQHYGMAQARYNGLKRNAAKLTLMCIGYNLKCAINIQLS